MLQPKRTKYRREQKNVMKGMAQRGNQLAFGSFGLKTLENCWLTAQQIEAARQAISRRMNREGQLWIRVFPVKPFTKKPLDTRMGKGKGDVAGYVAPITPGRILFEAEGVPFAVAKDAMRLAATKLPIHTKFVVRRDYVEE
jgi:large subunit ribosomal protein L16